MTVVDPRLARFALMSARLEAKVALGKLTMNQAMMRLERWWRMYGGGMHP